MFRSPARAERPCLAQLAILSCLVGGFFAALPAQALVVCDEVGGTPGEVVTIHMEIDSPLPNEILTVNGECRRTVDVTGTFRVEGTAASSWDFYIVVDASGSAFLTDSGADVNGNGVFGELFVDSIYYAELTAAQRFVAELDPLFHSVAVITFNDLATVQHALDSDLVAVDATLEALKMPAGLPGGTNYVSALDAVEAHAIAFGDFTRNQKCLFLSDGEPNDPAAGIHAAALRLDALGITIDSFALGALPGGGAELIDMAATTGGDFYQLDDPGDILDVLPTLGVTEPAFDFVSENLVIGSVEPVPNDTDAWTFSAPVELVPGLNLITLSIEVPGSPPTFLECGVDVTLVVEPAPALVGPALRLHREGPNQEELVLDWTLTSDLGPIETYVVTSETDVRSAAFTTLADQLMAKEWREAVPAENLVFYDVRRANCISQLSDD